MMHQKGLLAGQQPEAAGGEAPPSPALAEGEVTQAPGEPGQPSEENKALFDNVMANARDFISEPENSQRIVQAMQNGDVATATGDQAAQILTGIFESAGRAEVEIPAEVALAAAIDLIAEILSMAQASGALEGDPMEDEKLQMRALASFKKSVESIAQREEPPEQEMPPEGMPAGNQPPPMQGGGVLNQGRPMQA